MVDSKTIAGQMEKLKTVYRMDLTKDLMEIWYRQFKDCRDDWFTDCIDKFISMSKFPPVPADIWELYHEREKQQLERVNELEKIYNTLCIRYPGGAQATDDCRKEFRRLTLNKPISEAESIVKRAENVIKGIENGEGYISLLDYLKGL